MTVKKLIGKIHLWLGFISGLGVFVIAITGCILAFQLEIESVTKPYIHTPSRPGKKMLPPSALKAIAVKLVTDKHPNAVSYPGKDKSASVMFWGAAPDYYYQVFMDPYTGKVLKVWSEEDDFFHFILHGHFYLWLPPAIGQPVVASVTLIFVVMLISGLILWWPKNKNAAKQRFSVKWNANWRRVNYDLHNVLGFYILTIGLIIAFTGLVWGFQWFSKSLYFATSGGQELPSDVPPLSDTTRAAMYAVAEDHVWQELKANAPAHAGIFISFPKEKTEAISGSVNYRPGTYYKSDYYYFDRNTLAVLPAKGPQTGRFADAGFADKLRGMNYDIHVGAILGIPGKIIVFLASLVCASLPVTGIYIWWGRRNKKVKKSPVKRRAAPLIKNKA
ncbi:PepSY-associated TM helix domain-containing protein [Chitinophaga tropicalis]|uniref:PepSY domain-containing protein n=1 Tax=Chitinophaga tropicalis TaxID=2683588 RepID=A0A7K1U9H6_9BACT|nr:PepSY-associated TM helix domain-containing protein [Chitinophaga tropicalis]MVT11027.1 PepSY domain-containing protein [Chitinophaga tropicalis]